LDTRDKKFKDRDLYLDTNSLDPVTKAAVELCEEMRTSGDRRGVLRHRHLFREKARSPDELKQIAERDGRFSTFCIPDYFEDEEGDELPMAKMGAVLTGDPDSVLLPAGAKPHDAEFMLADKTPVILDAISLSSEQLGILGYFSRDLRELTATEFFNEGPGTLTSAGTRESEIETSVSDEEIRSFVTIFRRLYMKGEPANFAKAVCVFATALGDHPVARWVTGVLADYEAELGRKPDFIPLAGNEERTFTRKRLIDVFLYTRYAHQPNEKRTRQFKECLAQVKNQEALLTWLFLTAMWRCALQIRNAGVQIASFFDAYCGHHKVVPDVLPSVSDGHPGIGAREKKHEKTERILREKSEELATDLWKSRGRPHGGPMQFLNEALSLLEQRSVANPQAGASFRRTIAEQGLTQAARLVAYTIGYSTHTLEEFISLLEQHGITAVVDVRSAPYSRLPHFNREALQAALKVEGIDYVFMGRELGARREEPECYADRQVVFERVAGLPLFQEGLSRLQEGAKKYLIALMCAEKEPLNCHRAVLVCRHLKRLGFHIRHILADGSVEDHERTERRLLQQTGVAADLFEQHLTDSDLIERAYSERGKQIAYHAKEGVPQK